MRHPFITSTILSFSLLGTLNSGATVVKGTIIDTTTGEPEAFATIRIINGDADGILLDAVISDENGEFCHDIKASGEYTLVISSFGKVDIRKIINVGDEKEQELGTIGMDPSETMINELVVVAQKPLVKMTADEITYNVSEDSSSKTQTLIDMLRKVPMVTVDGEDNITVNGSSSFQVYVDGKPSLLFSGNPSRIFKSMPASTVKSIEVITNPGARYDAEGTGGVLNLIMDRSGGSNKLDNAYNASVGVQAGNRGYNGNIHANAKAGRFTSSLNLIYNDNRPGESVVDIIREEVNGRLEMLSEGKPEMKFTMGNISMEYEIDSLTTVGGSFSLNGFNMKSPGTTSTSFDGSMSGYEYGSDGIQRMGRNGVSGSVDLNRFFGKNKKNQISATYQIQSERNNNKSIFGFEMISGVCPDLTDRNSDNKEHTVYHIFQTDFTSRLNHWNSISAGAKVTLRNASSDSRYYLNGIFDEDGSMNYDNKNTIGALYGEYAFSTDKVSLKGGLRYEYTWQKVKYESGRGENFSTDYGIFVPSGSVSYSITNSSNIGLTYNMRISRPGISYLNPYEDRSNPTVLTYGNPDLEVEKGHNAGIVYNFFNPRFMMNINLSYNYTGNGIEQYSFMDGNIMNTTYGNIVKRKRTGLNAYINWMPFTKTRLFLNGSVSYTEIRSSKLALSNSGWQGNIMTGVQQTLPLDIKLGAFVMCSTKNYTLQGWNSGFQLLTMNLSRSFLDNNLNVSVGVLTGLSSGGNLNIKNHSAASGFSNYSCIKVPMAGVNVGVSYTFGNTRNISMKNKKTVEGDFIDRSSDMERIPSSRMN